MLAETIIVGNDLVSVGVFVRLVVQVWYGLIV